MVRVGVWRGFVLHDWGVRRRGGGGARGLGGFVLRDFGIVGVALVLGLVVGFVVFFVVVVVFILKVVQQLRAVGERGFFFGEEGAGGGVVVGVLGSFFSAGLEGGEFPEGAVVHGVEALFGAGEAIEGA
ncbi:MAG: hypothetical protein JWN40_399, partial [Phycisphaerales bacterium]|nr:hypothetical protein [Phycisphaerales bacterium]